ncbi:RelA/SpoT family protein [Vacuolonema iberomarrocanum]|uniref:RelA/SpoT family protein n=1 Tax=Vacuolonema iberomarrocanum TaxID=3454632 RepID=UPI0019EB0FAD|nr:bifunctional (p)ppGpp synthetase/guanosine-3',5'-bis(diphosphate) 3'-pyrophosphohydrolase [filamentous cyanobacterium LEGE 07170]
MVMLPACSSYDIELPEWLQRCLRPESASVPANGASAERTPELDMALICNAFQFAYELHEGQRRASGEPYIAHPVAVAGLLRDLGGSSSMVAAGFLHDVVEDTDITLEELEQRFGEDVSRLVEGVTKLSKFNFSSKTERQAENFRRMFLAMAQDIRVIVVKLADRLHNMRTLEHLRPEKQRRIAQETLEIFAPLANRLGIGRFKWELEDLSFKYLESDAYKQMRDLVMDRRADREAYLDEAIALLRPNLEKAGIGIAEINGRPKHLYGIYKKMERQQKEFHEIFDVTAIRIIVNRKEDCYRSLAIVHDKFRPIPGRFKDYIGLPKPNRYQSLHTVVIGPQGRPIEVQIRTEEMHHIAEYGIAAHWKYKEAGHSGSKLTSDDEKFTWLRQLLDWPSDLKDAQEFLDNVRTNLFEDEVFVFTPQGDVIALTQKSTPVDFAYRIHTEVGNHCAGAKVNGRIVTLDTPLRNGDIVEIITQKNSHPSLDWLNFAVTAGARNRIRQWYKRSHRDENMQRGRDMLEKELGKQGFEALLKSEPAQATAERCNYQNVDDLLAALGYGEVTLNLVVNRLREEIKARQPITPAPELALLDEVLLPVSEPTPLPSSGTPIVGIEGLLYSIAGCCNPIPGEPIIGVVTMSGRGISIHRQDCKNVEQIPGDRLIPVSWNEPDGSSRPQTYPVDLQIEVIDRVGVLKDILSRLSDSNINVRSVQVKTYPGQTAAINLGIDVQDHSQLERTFTKIRKMSDVLQMRRVCEVNAKGGCESL